MYPFVMRILTKPVKTRHPINAVIPICPCADPLCPYDKPKPTDIRYAYRFNKTPVVVLTEETPNESA